MPCKVVVLCGPNATHRNTCATLIRAGVQVAGICIADQKTCGVNFSYLSRSVKRKGFGITLSRAAARAAYWCRNRRRDLEIFGKLFNEDAIGKTLREWNGPVCRTARYDSPDALLWLRDLNPDILVAHTPYWIGKAVRRLPKSGIVLGGHPGLTPEYRGSHAAFWAVYRGNPQDVGCTVFMLDEGVDTGDIVSQSRLSIEPDDSFITLGWKGMIKLAEMQASILRDYEAGIDIPRRRIERIPDHSEFDQPTLREYLAYLSCQRAVR